MSEQRQLATTRATVMRHYANRGQLRTAWLVTELRGGAVYNTKRLGYVVCNSDALPVKPKWTHAVRFGSLDMRTVEELLTKPVISLLHHCNKSGYDAMAGRVVGSKGDYTGKEGDLVDHLRIAHDMLYADAVRYVTRLSLQAYNARKAL